MAYANTGEFNVLYPTRRKMANILKRIVDEKLADGDGTLVSSIRINAKITGFQKLEIQIVAAYYFIFLNNGAYLWNGGQIAPRDFVSEFTEVLGAKGITAEIYSQYTAWLTKKYPMVQAIEVLEKQQKLVYTFEALFAPPDFVQGFPLDV